MTQAIVLFAHGARDARWSITLQALAQRVREALPDRHIGMAFLEFQAPTLVQAIDAALQAGALHIDVMPVFWASGGHVANDVPPLLAALRHAHPQVSLRLLPVLSELPGMLDFIATRVVQQTAAHADGSVNAPKKVDTGQHGQHAPHSPDAPTGLGLAADNDGAGGRNGPGEHIGPGVPGGPNAPTP